MSLEQQEKGTSTGVEVSSSRSSGTDLYHTINAFEH